MTCDPNKKAGDGLADSAGGSYLWDRTPPVDPVVANLERTLGNLGHRGRTPEIGVARLRWTPRLLVAATIVLAGLVVWLAIPPRGSAPPRTWEIASTTGSPIIGERQRFKGPGQTMREVSTDAASTVKLTNGEATMVMLGPSTKAHVIDGTDEHPWATVMKGSVEARIGSGDRPVMLGVLGEAVELKPGSSTAVRIADGRADVEVRAGQAEIQWEKSGTRLLGPALCEIESGRGPELPVSLASSQRAQNLADKLRSVLGRKDLKAQDSALATVLKEATPKEAPMLWNLLSRVEGEQRRHVRDVLAKLIEAPAGPERERILLLDPGAMDAWWDAAVTAAK